MFQPLVLLSVQHQQRMERERQQWFLQQQQHVQQLRGRSSLELFRMSEYD